MELSRWSRIKDILQGEVGWCFNWPPNWGIGHVYYDGDIYYIHVGIFTISYR